MAEIVWLRGENGAILTIDRAQISKFMMDRLLRGEIKRIHPDGAPWEGDLFPPEPLPGPDEFIMVALRGYRSWPGTEPRSGWLWSSNDRFAWPPGEWAAATCKLCELRGAPVPSLTPCRDYGYGCGLYAASTPSIGVRHHIWGVIEAKGRIVCHDDGFRAEQARVIALALPPATTFTATWGGQPGATYNVDVSSVSPDLVLAAARLYDVPALPPEQLEAEYPPDTG